MAATNRWTTWSCCTTTVTARNTAVEWERRALRPARGVCEGLSCVPGNRHAQFLGGGRAVRLSRYPTDARHGRTRPGRRRTRISIPTSVAAETYGECPLFTDESQ